LLRATSSDAFLLGLESLMRRTGQGPHLAATVIQLAGEPDPDAIRKAADALGRRHALLHAHLRRSPITFEAGWLTGPRAAVPVMIHETGNPTEIITRILNSGSIDIFRPGPNLEIHLLPQGENHTILLLWPHSLFDAIGIDKLIAELDSTDPEPRHDWGETTTASGSAAALWKTAHPVIEEMRTFPAANIRSLHQPRCTPGAACFEVLAFTHVESQTIHAKMAGAVGELLKIPYFAALAARAVAAVIRTRHAVPPDILLTLPIQRIGNPAARPLFQNHMVAWSLLLTHQSLDTLATAAMALYRSYASFRKRGLPVAMEALIKLNARCPSRLYLLPIKHYLKGEICSLFHSHVGNLADHTETLFTRPILNAWHIPSVSTPPGIGVFFSERNARLTCTLSWREGSLGAAELVILRQQLLADLGVEAPLAP
jgi:hypothetical protein